MVPVNFRTGPCEDSNLIIHDKLMFSLVCLAPGMRIREL